MPSPVTLVATPALILPGVRLVIEEPLPLMIPPPLTTKFVLTVIWLLKVCCAVQVLVEVRSAEAPDPEMGWQLNWPVDEFQDKACEASPQVERPAPVMLPTLMPYVTAIPNGDVTVTLEEYV